MIKKKRIVLGIECTAHTFGASIINDRYEILSNYNISMKSTYSGLIPVEIMEHHAEFAKSIIQDALKQSNTQINDITHISISNEPGMGHALRVGNIIVKTLSQKNKIPVIKVNHSLAHLTTGIMELNNNKNITLLYIAGANTQIWNLKGEELMLVGETLDMGIGHLLDLCARDLGYGFPGGPIIEKFSLKHPDNSIIEFPYTIKGMDVSFGGISTSFKTKINKLKAELKSNKITEDEYERIIAKLCYSLQEHAFGSLIEAAERAIALQDSEGLALIGGVALNKRFVEMANLMCNERKAILRIPKRELLADNAAMIAIEGLRLVNAGEEGFIFEKNKEYRIKPYKRLERKINYRRTSS
jgi:N6-L-threonylcarbamoyladenine synthase